MSFLQLAAENFVKALVNSALIKKDLKKVKVVFEIY